MQPNCIGLTLHSLIGVVLETIAIAGGSFGGGFGLGGYGGGLGLDFALWGGYPGFGFPWLSPPLGFQINTGSVFGSPGVGFYDPGPRLADIHNYTQVKVDAAGTRIVDQIAVVPNQAANGSALSIQGSPNGRFTVGGDSAISAAIGAARLAAGGGISGGRSGLKR